MAAYMHQCHSYMPISVECLHEEPTNIDPEQHLLSLHFTLILLAVLFMALNHFVQFSPSDPHCVTLHIATLMILVMTYSVYCFHKTTSILLPTTTQVLKILFLRRSERLFSS